MAGSVAGRARPNPQNHDARGDRAERLKRRGWTVPFDMFADIILTRDIPELGLRVGDVGTIVERHLVPDGREEGYSVEFFNMTGNTVAVVTVPVSALRPPTPADRPAVRAVNA